MPKLRTSKEHRDLKEYRGLSAELRRAKPIERIKSTVAEESMEQLTLQRFSERITRENAERIEKNLPIAKYDIDSKRAYLEYADGSRKYAD